MDDMTFDAAADRVEQVLWRIIELPAAEQRAALAVEIAADPTIAAQLQERFDLYARFLRATPTDAESRRSFGEYELVRELGRGGMGIVWLARQRRGDHERLVALKLLRDRALASPQARERLRREGEATFRLDHPGICQVLDVGEVDDTPFLTMRFVAGATLAERLAEANASDAALALPHAPATDTRSDGTASGGVPHRLAAILLLVEQVAHALHTAHEAGLVHRDIKPGNIMVTPEGVPVLLDFGLVQDASSPHDLTATGQTLGTPTYMSPEQIDSSARTQDRTTDVYSLGATLYELLTQRPPVAGPTREALFRAILAGEPAARCAQLLEAPSDLRVVVATALAPDPGQRYATALAFAEDLRRVRLAQPILARPPSPWRRLQLWCRRNPTAAVLLALLTVAVGAALGFARQATQRAADAEAARLEAHEDFQSARNAVAEMARLADELLFDVPWLELERRQMLDQALVFHRQVARRRLDSEPLLREEAVLRIQAARTSIAVYDVAAARVDLAAAIDLLGKQPHRSDREAMRWLACAHWCNAKLAQDTGDDAASDAAAKAAIAELERLRATGAWTQNDVEAWLTVHRTLAETAVARNDADAAHAAFTAGLALPCEPNHQQALLERAQLLRLRAGWHRDQRAFQAAGEDLLAALAITKEALQRRAEHRGTRALLAEILWIQGTVAAAADDPAAALTAYDESLPHHEALFGAFPTSRGPRTNLAMLLNNRAAALRRLHRTDEARADLERATSLLADLPPQASERPATTESMARVRLQLANAVGADDPTRAIQLLRTSGDAIELLVAAQPGVPKYRDLAVRVISSLGARLALAGEHEQAGAAFAAAMQHSEAVLQHDPGSASKQRSHAVLCFNLGTLRCELGELEAAARHVADAVAADQRSLALAPDDSRGFVQLTKHRMRLAQVASLRAAASALPDWRAADAIADEMPAALRAKVEIAADWQLDRATIARGLGEALFLAGDTNGANAALARARDLLALQPGHLTANVERFLCAGTSAAVAEAMADATAAQQHLRTLGELAPAVGPKLPTSRLHLARVAAAMPALLAQSRRQAMADVEAALASLSSIAAPR